MTVKTRVKLKNNRDLIGEAIERGKYYDFVKVLWFNSRHGPNPNWMRLKEIVFVVPAGRKEIK